LSKDRKSLEKAEKEGFDFIPLAVETFGVWSTLALETLKKMCSRLRQYSSLDSTYPHFYYLMQKLSVGLQRHNANLIMEKYSSFLENDHAYAAFL